MEKYKVVIWGADNYNTLGVLRSLSKADLDVTLLVNGAKHGVATASKYCREYHLTRNIDEGVNYLLQNYQEQNDDSKKPVLIPGGDATSLGGAKYYGQLNKRFHMMCTDDPKVLINITDKNIMGAVAKKAGLLTPEAQDYHTGIRKFTVSFPVILKPVHSEGRIEFKTKVFQYPEDLIKFEKYLNPKNKYIMQQFIQRQCDVVVYGCKLPNGELKLAGHHTLERWSDDGGGSFGHLSPEIPDYLQPNELNKFFDSIGYHGLFSAEYGFVDGKAYFYEVNFRNDGFCHLSYQAGANLPLLWVCACLHLPFDESYKMTKSIVGINEIYDVANVLHGNISWRQYRSDKQKASAFHFYDAEDPQPYYNMRKRMIWEIPLRAILKTIRPKIIWILNRLNK